MIIPIATATEQVYNTSSNSPELFSLDELDWDPIPRKRLHSRRGDANALDKCIDDAIAQESYTIADLIRGQRPPKKKTKTQDLKPIVYIRFNTKASGRPRPVTLRALLDSGASGCLVNSKHANKLKMKKLSKVDTVWTTPGGSMQTSYTTKAEFTIPELHDNKLISW